MSHSKDDDRVGYGRPPRHTRFKPGQSGNPRGRPRRGRSFKTLLEQALEKPLEISSRNGKARVSAREALAMRIVNEAVKGNVRHIQLLERLLGEAPPQPFQPMPSDELVIQQLLAECAPSKPENEVADQGVDGHGQP